MVKTYSVSENDIENEIKTEKEDHHNINMIIPLDDNNPETEDLIKIFSTIDNHYKNLLENTNYFYNQCINKLEYCNIVQTNENPKDNEPKKFFEISIPIKYNKKMEIKCVIITVI